MPPKQALGRGLKALLPEAPKARTGLVNVALDRIVANPSQPRQHFDDAGLRELAASIREHGLLQPLLVSEHTEGGYRLIAGERRLRAARLAGLDSVPAVIREQVNAEEELELALVENLQRRDLTPLEEARAFDHLRAHLGLSQADIARRVGFDRSTVANSLRLLKLPDEIQEMVENGDLSGGHARTLLGFSDDDARISWALQVVAAGLSVRDLERAVAEAREPELRPTKKNTAPADPNLLAAEEALTLHLGTKVRIRSGRRGGSITITCSDQNELMRVFDVLMGVNDGPEQ